jgi:hypothetical protein
MSGEVTEGWRKLHTEELHSLHSSEDISKMNKPGRTRSAGNAADVYVSIEVIPRLSWNSKLHYLVHKIRHRSVP